MKAQRQHKFLFVNTGCATMKSRRRKYPCGSIFAFHLSTGYSQWQFSKISFLTVHNQLRIRSTLTNQPIQI